MIDQIVETPDFVTILGASQPKPEDIDEALKLAPVIVAADGGAQFALDAGHVPDAVIGDFDSIPANLAEAVPKGRLHRIAEQDSTDFEKCLSRVTSPLCLAVGFTGRRLDHELAVYATLTRYPDRPCIVIGSDDVVFAARAAQPLDLDLPADMRVSLFPLSPVRGRATGLRWSIDDLAFDPAGVVGTSNAATGPVGLTFETAGMLVILPRAALGAAMSALAPGQGAVRAR